MTKYQWVDLARPSRLGHRTAILGVLLAAFFGIGSASAQPKVVVTLKPIHALVAMVMDGVGTPAVIIEGTQSAHAYSLKPSDTKRLNDAEIVFRISEAFEPFTARLVRSLPKTVEVVSLASETELVLHARRTGATFDKEGHASHGHSHAAASSTMSADLRDGHIWLDPRNAKVLIDGIANVLIRKDASRAETYKANAAKATAEIDALDRELEADLRAIAGKPYVVFHDAIQYFERRYGLEAVGSITVSPEVPPSGKRLTDVRKKIQSLAASCVFSEPNFEAKVVQSVIEGTNARTGVLDPEGARLIAGRGLYAELLRGLAKSLRGCLTG